VNQAKLDALAESIIADAESHMEWIDGRHLKSKKDEKFFAQLLAGHLDKLSAEDHPVVVDRLVTFGRCLDTEFDSHALSETFLAGLKDALGGPLPEPPEPHHTEGWTFKTKARGGIRFEARVKVRKPGGGTIGT
jgi:hypothetical protein